MSKFQLVLNINLCTCSQFSNTSTTIWNAMAMQRYNWSLLHHVHPKNTLVKIQLSSPLVAISNLNLKGLIFCWSHSMLAELYNQGCAFWTRNATSNVQHVSPFKWAIYTWNKLGSFIASSISQMTHVAPTSCFFLQISIFSTRVGMHNIGCGFTSQIDVNNTSIDHCNVTDRNFYFLNFSGRL